MNFALFILLSAILLIRPEELVDLGSLHVYLIVIVLCTLTTIGGLLSQLSPQALKERPITVCVLGLVVAMALSQLVRGQFGLVLEQVSDFAKVVLYFLLLMAVVTTPERLKTFMGWIVAFVIVLSTLGLLQYHGYIDFEQLRPVDQREFDLATGETIILPRLRSTGIYHDPNDLCLILVTGSLFCFCRAALSRSIVAKIVWLAPIGLFGYAITLTYSRGGLLGFLAAVLAVIFSRFGWKKTLPLAGIALPVMLVLFAGRQTNFSTGQGDTGQGRIQIWAQGLTLMYQNPVTGIGVGEFDANVGYVAHNSFVQAHVEMGLLGGSLFLGAFYLGALGVWRTREEGVLDEEPTLRRMRPFVFAMLIAYAVGAYSVSRNFVVPTYMVLGTTAAYIAMVYHDGPPDWFRFDRHMVKRLGIVGVVGLIAMVLFTKTAVQWGP